MKKTLTLPPPPDPAYWLRLCEAHDGPVQLDAKKLAELCRLALGAK